MAVDGCLARSNLAQSLKEVLGMLPLYSQMSNKQWEDNVERAGEGLATDIDALISFRISQRENQFRD